MIRLVGLGHVGLRVRDLDMAVRFYCDVVGLSVIGGDGAQARLALAGAGHCLSLLAEKGPPLHHVAFALRPDQKVGRAAEELRAAGVDVLEGAAEPGGHGEAIRCRDPDGYVLELLGTPPDATEAAAGRRLRPDRLQHVVLQTLEAERAAAFYSEKLGFRVSDWMGRKFVWLRCGTDHHDLAIVYGEAPGMDHVAYEITGWDEIKAWCDFLARGGVQLLWGPGRHGPGNNLFVMFPDPEGNRIELSCEMEQFYDDCARYHPRDWTDVATAINLWGGSPPAWRA